MNRQKSNRTLLIEQERAARMEDRKRKREEKARDKAIREERRRQKAAEQQAKREERMKRQLVHESVERNGVPRVQPEESRFGLREAMTYDPHAICGRCHMMIRESDLYGIYCERCHYKQGGNDPKEDELKAEANRAVPGTEGGGKNGTAAPAGQLTLDLYHGPRGLSSKGDSSMKDDNKDALATLAGQVRISTGGVFDSVEALSLAIRMLGKQYNMIIPGGAVGVELPLLYAAGVSFVFVDPEKETYPIFGDAGEKKRGISKGALDRIAAAAGVRWNPHLCGRVDDGSNPYIVEYQAAATVLQLDGTERMIHASKRIDLRAEKAVAVEKWGNDAQEISRIAEKAGLEPWPQILQARQHILSLAETKAKSRAIRTLGVRTSYDTADLAKGFVIFRLQFTGRSADPEVEKEISLMIARRALSSASALFGGEGSRENTPTSFSKTVPKIMVKEAELEKDENEDKPLAAKSAAPPAAKPPAPRAAGPAAPLAHPKDDPLLICGEQVAGAWPRKPCSDFTIEELRRKIAAAEKKQPKWEPRWAAKNLKDLLAMKAWLAHKEMNPEGERGGAFDDYPESGSEDVPF